MLTMMAILTIASCAIEYKLTSKHPSWRLFLARHRVIALIASLGLSLLLGTLFGAEGMICFGAGLLSTIIMNVIYALEPTLEEYKPAFKLMSKTFANIIKLIMAILILPFHIITKVLKIFKIELV